MLENWMSSNSTWSLSVQVDRLTRQRVNFTLIVAQTAVWHSQRVKLSEFQRPNRVIKVRKKSEFVLWKFELCSGSVDESRVWIFSRSSHILDTQCLNIFFVGAVESECVVVELVCAFLQWLFLLRCMKNVWETLRGWNWCDLMCNANDNECWWVV